MNKKKHIIAKLKEIIEEAKIKKCTLTEKNDWKNQSNKIVKNLNKINR